MRKPTRSLFGDAIEVSIPLVSWNTRDQSLRSLDFLANGVEAAFSYEVVAVDYGSEQALLWRGDISHLIVNAEKAGDAAGVIREYAAPGERESGAAPR